MIGRKLRMEELQRELDRVINKIDRTDIQKIILFGSLTRGQSSLTSDIDLIIVKKTKEGFLDRLDSVYKEIEPNLAVDILVYTPQEIDDMSQWNNFIKRAFKEGKVLYET